MILDVKTLKEEDSVRTDLGEGKYEIVDTIDAWVVKDSNSITVGIFDKFSTISILLYDKESEY